jgi:hypothetical protein
MKKIMAIAFLILVNYVSKGQTTEEWLQQQQTQKKYLIKQISALHEYLGYVQKGFAIAEKGLTTISAIKHGDYHLHDVFFSSLKQVNPVIKRYSRVADIVSLQHQILRDSKKSKELAVHLEIDEAVYINKVIDQMLSLCSGNMSELSLITSADESEMKDDERIKRIDKLYTDMVDKSSFTQHFLNQVKVLIANRVHERNGISVTRNLYGKKR